MFPEILKKWNDKDYKYFTGRDQYKNGIQIYDTLEIMSQVIIRLLEYGCKHDMRIQSSVSYGQTIPALSTDRSISYLFTMFFDGDDDELDFDEDSLSGDQLLYHAVSSFSTYPLFNKKRGIKPEHTYNSYLSLSIFCEHETDMTGSMTKVMFGNVNYIDYTRPGDFDTCRPGERENKKIRFEAFINKIKEYVHAHEDVNAWLILQGITL